MTEFNRNILFQYFSGTASPFQVKLIEEWLAMEGNDEIYFKYLEEWEKENQQFIPDVEFASQKLKLKIDGITTQEIQSTELVTVKKFSSPMWWAAASIIVLIVSYFAFGDTITYETYNTAYGQVKEFSLPDGSNVVLNANSTLMVPRFTFNKSREVMLNGEAAFSVVHDKNDKKFVVNTGSHLNVEVLGTEFSVYNRNDINRVELKNGMVKLHFNSVKGSGPLLMKPGDVASLSTNGNLQLKHQQPPANFITWKDHRFVFDKTPLSDALQTIKDIFGDEIILNDPGLTNRNITGSFKAESSRELLNVLAEINDLELTEQSGKLILRSKAQ